MTDREEKDLESLLSQSDGALSNAEKFMEQLAKDLSLLDGVNLHKIIFPFILKESSVILHFPMPSLGKHLQLDGIRSASH